MVENELKRLESLPTTKKRKSDRMTWGDFKESRLLDYLTMYPHLGKGEREKEMKREWQTLYPPRKLQKVVSNEPDHKDQKNQSNDEKKNVKVFNGSSRPLLTVDPNMLYLEDEEFSIILKDAKWIELPMGQFELPLLDVNSPALVPESSLMDAPPSISFEENSQVPAFKGEIESTQQVPLIANQGQFNRETIEQVPLIASQGSEIIQVPLSASQDEFTSEPIQQAPLIASYNEFTSETIQQVPLIASQDHDQFMVPNDIEEISHLITRETNEYDDIGKIHSLNKSPSFLFDEFMEKTLYFKDSQAVVP